MWRHFLQKVFARQRDPEMWTRGVSGSGKADAQMDHNQDTPSKDSDMNRINTLVPEQPHNKIYNDCRGERQ